MEGSLPFFTAQAHDLFVGSMPSEHGFDQMVGLFTADEDAGLLVPGDGYDEFVAISNGGGSSSSLLGEAAGFCSSALQQSFGLYSSPCVDVLYYSNGADPCSSLPAPAASGDGDGRLGSEKDEDDGESSGTAAAPRPPARDRARTLVSERRRRGSMKEKLYELRSLVPNITKMDKASIIGDAIMYVRELQRQARCLTEEISVLESPPTSSQAATLLQPSSPAVVLHHGSRRTSPAAGGDRAVDVGSSPGRRRGEILQFTAFEVGDVRRFYVRVEVGGAGEGAPAALYRAVEALTTFLHLESSVFSSSSSSSAPASDRRHEVNFSLKVMEGEMISMFAVKLWVMTALMNEGFVFTLGT